MNMDQSDQQMHQQEVVSTATPMTPPYQTLPMASSIPSPNQQLAYQQAQQFHNQQNQQIQVFWSNQTQDIKQMNDFKNHSLPLARIKKIMKADEDVRMISAEAPIVFAKACEMFILELTLRSWIHTEENKRRTLQKSDIASAITRTDIFDFLVDIVPRDEVKEDGLGISSIAFQAGGSSSDHLPYYYMLPHHPSPVEVSGMFYATQQACSSLAYMHWPQPPQQEPPKADT
ncbi:hypothetical protein Sjap_026516 [Stephania japonica]|uniref:Core Histone H2A/H2B/H3 domain-containing protein n=1 Tax=Stephania japonica TaxID=461633 RepID=A0AAP0E6A1_9MAGN